MRAPLRCLLLTAICLATGATRALATPGASATIEELVDRADLIVRATRRHGGQFEAVKSYKGFRPGLPISIQGLEQLPTKVGAVISRDAEDLPRNDAVFFLEYQAVHVYRPVATGAGVKWLHDGRVFAYAPTGMGYELTRSHESATHPFIKNYLEAQEPLTLDLLEMYIKASLRRSREFEAALALRDRKRRVHALSTYLNSAYGHSEYYARKALDALAKIGAPAAPAVLSILEAEVSHPSRHVLVKRLGAFHDPRVVAFLLSEMKISTRRCRANVIYALGMMKSREAVEPICGLLGQVTDEYAVKVAVGALAGIGDRRATSAIAAHLSHDSQRVRLECASALAALKDPQAFAPLAKALGDPLRRGDAYVRSRLLDALYRCDRARAVPVIIEHLRCPEGEVAHQARTCLHWLSRTLRDKPMDYDSMKAWLKRQPKDDNGVILLDQLK